MAEDNYQYQPRPLPSWTPIGSDSLSASHSGVVEIGGPNVSPASLDSPFSNPDFTGGGGGGGAAPDCGTSWSIGNITTSSVGLPCDAPVSTLTADTLALEDTISISTAAVESASGVIQIIELDVPHMGAPGKRQFVCGDAYAAQDMAGFSSYLLFLGNSIPEVSSSDVGPDTKYPIGVDFETIFKWYYRVRVWIVVVDFDASAATTLTTSSINISLLSPTNGFTFLPSGFTTEAYFSTILPTGLTALTQQSASDADSGAGSSCNGSCDLINATFGSETRLFFKDVATEPIVRVGSLYYPSTQCDMVLTSSILANQDPGSNATSRTRVVYLNRPTAAATVVGIPWEIDGESFTKNGSYNDNTTTAGASPPAVTVTADFQKVTWTPSQYWEYDPGDGGGPIWDSVTGAELRSPFSVQNW